MTTFADKRLILERLAKGGVDDLHLFETFTQDQLLFLRDLGDAGMLCASASGWYVDGTVIRMFRGLREGVLRQLGSSARLDVLQDHDLIRRKGALWQWAWIE